MNVDIRDIGNSKGVIIPSALLKEAGIKGSIDMSLKDGCIVLKPIQRPREKWAESIQKDPPSAEEEIFMDGIDDPELLEEWEW